MSIRTDLCTARKTLDDLQNELAAIGGDIADEKAAAYVGLVRMHLIEARLKLDAALRLPVNPTLAPAEPAGQPA